MQTLAKQLESAGSAVSSAGDSMSKTRDLTNKMAHIVKAIDEIAFQTNLLALNAAVEAARAGESGQGFAVVADEVRALAMRSAQAARDTADLIEDAHKSTQDGTANTDRAVHDFQGLHATTGAYTRMVEEIRYPSGEQTRAVQSMSEALHRIEELAQNTAAEASQTSNSAESLQTEAVRLHQVVETLTAMA
jgi:methyl-accepting chemotaxis protein